jgi:very-short-patch-repair endonuclease
MRRERRFSDHPRSIYCVNANPADYAYCSSKKLFFNCYECNHIFEKQISTITKMNQWCPYCSNFSTLFCDDDDCGFCYFKSFASHPRAKYLVNPEEARNIGKGVDKKLEFECPDCKHRYKSRVNVITRSEEGVGCPFCNSDNLCEKDDCNFCFNKSFASHPKSAFIIDENSRMLNKGSKKKYLFKCDKCPHQFKCSLDRITSERNPNWCPYCANKKLCDNKNCQDCLPKSFATLDKSNFLTDKTIDPRMIFLRSSNKYEFKCSDCNHKFMKIISDLSRTDRDGFCPYCSGKKLCENADCELCFNKSFASHPKHIHLIDKSLNPRMLFKRTDKKYDFLCPDCNHQFTKVISVVCDTQLNSFCPYCSNRKLCQDEDCAHCLQNSFKSNPKHTQLLNGNPRMLFRSCAFLGDFQCNDCGKQFQKRLNNVFEGSWCPFCVNKTEKKLLDFLLQSFPNIIFQFKAKWCMSDKLQHIYLPFDFCIPEYKLIIELDGRQHFEVIDFFHNNIEETMERDLKKMQLAKKKGYSMIRIIQEDVWHDKYNWQQKLMQYIKAYDEPQNIYLCQNNEYDIYF